MPSVINIKFREFIQSERDSKAFAKELEYLNYQYRYTYLAFWKRGLRAPFIHVTSAVLFVLFWKQSLITNVFTSFFLSYLSSSILFFVICHLRVTNPKVSTSGQVTEIVTLEGGKMFMALDTTGGRTVVAGMIALRPLPNNAVEITRNIVRKNYRGRGIGRALLSEALQSAVDSNYDVVIAEVANVAGPFDVRPMYERRGFRYRETCYRPNALLPLVTIDKMIKELK